MSLLAAYLEEEVDGAVDLCEDGYVEGDHHEQVDQHGIENMTYKSKPLSLEEHQSSPSGKLVLELVDERKQN